MKCKKSHTKSLFLTEGKTKSNVKNYNSVRKKAAPPSPIKFI